MSSGFNDRPLAPFAGILSLGIGDTMVIFLFVISLLAPASISSNYCLSIFIVHITATHFICLIVSGISSWPQIWCFEMQQSWQYVKVQMF